MAPSDDLHHSWGRRVKARRQELLLSQEALAALCGLRQSTISRVEAGVTAPRDRVKWLLAGGLGKTVEELFPYPPVTPPAPEPEAVAS